MTKALNFVMISPHFPYNFEPFAHRLHEAGVNTLGIADTPYEMLPQSLRDNLTEYYRVDNMEDYDTVFVGFPIWWYREPSVIDTFIEAYDFSGKTIVPFCSHGGGRFGQSLTAIAKLAPEARIGEGLAVNYSGGASMPGDVTEWLESNGLK